MMDATGLPAAELGREQAELLPDRTTLSAIEIGKTELDPGSVAVNSPGANQVYLEPHAEANNVGGCAPVANAVNQSNTSIVQW
jgi:hypothetical protein